MTMAQASLAEKLHRAHYLIALEAAVAQLLRDDPGDRTLAGVLTVQEPRLREIADLLGEIRREVGACPAP